MSIEAVSTHTIKSDAATTVVTHTTTVVNEYEETNDDKDHHYQYHHVHDHDHKHDHHNYDELKAVEGVKKTFRDYWLPSHTNSGSNNLDDEHDGDEDENEHTNPSRFSPNSVVRRAYDYWKTLSQDSEETARELVHKARIARDETSKEAKWAMLGYKREAREAYETAEKRYRDALAAAEKVHEEALERARSRWFQQREHTQKEVGEKVEEMTHQKWDQFKAAVDSLVFNPPKYVCSPSSQYWFSRQDPVTGSGWDCREIWDHSDSRKHGHGGFKMLPKKEIPLENVHRVLEGLWKEAGSKARTGPSSDSALKYVRDRYHGILDRIARGEKGAVEELDTLMEKIKGRLNEAKYSEEQTDAWLTSQWNAVVHNTGEAKDQYEHIFKSAIKSVEDARTQTYNAIFKSLEEPLNSARGNIQEVIRTSKDDKAKIQKTIQEASRTFATTVKDVEAKIKAVPKSAYDHALESFRKDSVKLKAKLEHAAKVASSLSLEAFRSAAALPHEASKSALSLSRHASKSVSSAAARVAQSGEGLHQDASHHLHDAEASADVIKNRASRGYERATASVSSMWTASTPFEPHSRAHDSYHQLLGDAKHSLFAGGHQPGYEHHLLDTGYHELSSLYGALTALYMLFLARQIWLRRRCCPEMSAVATDAHGNLYVTKSRRRHSQSHSQVHGSDSSDDQLHQYSHRHHHHHQQHEKHDKDIHHEEHRGHHHHHNSFSAVLKTFTSVVPATMVLLVLLELAGFSRVALHTLFASLIISQMVQYGWMNSVMEQLGILDSALGEAVSGHSAQAMGRALARTTFGLAAVANAINVLHDE